MKVSTAGLVFLEVSALLTAATRGRCSKMWCNSLSYYTLRIECAHSVLLYAHFQKLFNS